MKRVLLVVPRDGAGRGPECRFPGQVHSHLIGDGAYDGSDFDHRSPEGTGEIVERYEFDERGVSRSSDPTSVWG